MLYVKWCYALIAQDSTRHLGLFYSDCH